MISHDLAVDIVHSDKSTIGRSKIGSSSDQRLSGLPGAVRWALGTLSEVAPGIATSLARRLFLRPPRFKSPRRELWWETEAESFDLHLRLSTGPKRLAAWRWGSGGPTVLLIHGWGGRALQLAAFASVLVDAGYRVLAVDLPGHGRSSGTSTSLPEAAEAIGAVLEYAAEQPGGIRALIAHSFGCASSAVAFSKGAVLPERVLFLAPPSDLDAVTERFSELTGFSLEVMARMRAELDRRFGFRWSSLHPWRLASQIETPLLVIHDALDTETPWTAGQHLAAAAPDGHFHITAGLGHFRLLRDEGILAHALAFIGSSSSDQQGVDQLSVA